MVAVLLAFGLVTGIVGLAWRESDDPAIRRFIEKKRLGHLAAKPDNRITRDQAEDGLVLARRHGQTALVKRFGKLVASRRRSTP